MRRYGWWVLVTMAAVCGGCTVTDYPIITDDRGDYSGIVRTAHKAYIIESAQFAQVYDDGSDELFSMVYQNQYGDQTLYNFNNYDPTASTLFLDQTYCDWRYEGCAAVRAWNPRQNDDPFDREMFIDCSGARSVSIIVSYGDRIGECGDGLFIDDRQGLAHVFADLETVGRRGGEAYVAPIKVRNTLVTLTSIDGVAETVPRFGGHHNYVTNELQLVAPVTPNVRHQLRGLEAWVTEHGERAAVEVSYEGVSGSIDVAFSADGLRHNGGRI